MEDAQASLKSEKAKLAHTAFTLTHNAELSVKYDEILKVLESLLEDCDGELLEIYKDWQYSEDMSLLVLCSMAIADFAVMQLNKVYENEY